MVGENHIPAWKRLGLKVKKSQTDDPLSIPTHLEDSTITKSQAKGLKSQKRSREDDGKGKSNKPAKRKKLPKNERPPPPEKDQLAYLRQYANDRENWKFSKQKQNWIIKHMLIISEEYKGPLFMYLKTVEGGSRIRLVNELKEVIGKWNKYASAVADNLLNGNDGEDKYEQEKADANVESKKDEEEEESDEPDENNGADSDEKLRQAIRKKRAEAKKKKAEEEERKKIPTLEQAIRAQQLLEAISNEKLLLSSVDDEDNSENTAGQKETADAKNKSDSRAASGSSNNDEEKKANEKVMKENKEEEKPNEDASKRVSKKEKKKSKKKEKSSSDVQSSKTVGFTSPSRQP